MAQSGTLLVYFYENLGVPGKGPHYIEPFHPSRTIGDVIQSMTNGGCYVPQNKRVELLKMGNYHVQRVEYNKLDPFLLHTMTLSEYLSWSGQQSSSSNIILACIFC